VGPVQHGEPARGFGGTDAFRSSPQAAPVRHSKPAQVSGHTTGGTGVTRGEKLPSSRATPHEVPLEVARCQLLAEATRMTAPENSDQLESSGRLTCERAGGPRFTYLRSDRSRTRRFETYCDGEPPARQCSAVSRRGKFGRASWWFGAPYFTVTFA
jgi:hypothetical protein